MILLLLCVAYLALCFVTYIFLEAEDGNWPVHYNGTWSSLLVVIGVFISGPLLCLASVVVMLIAGPFVLVYYGWKSRPKGWR